MTSLSKVAVTYTPTQIAQLKGLGFSDALVGTPRRLIASVEGRDKTGKTNFALTAPPPIVFFNIDIGTEGVVGKFQEAGKQVFVYDVRVPKGASQNVYTTMWSDFKHRMGVAYTLGTGSVVVDTSSEGFELARLSHFGKLTQVMPHHYTEVNSEWRELMRLAYDSAMNTIFVHKQKPKYVNNARTSEYELAGFGEMGYLSQINLVTYCEPNIATGKPDFSVYVKNCRHNPDVSGQVLRGPLCNFEFLLSLVHSK